jgi:methionine biosynthesis protein MetW
MLSTDHQQILTLIEPHQRILDLGCGDGSLQQALQQQKQADVQGVELDADKVQQALAKGLLVYQGDLEEALNDYDDNAFDVVILNKALQVTQRPMQVVQAMARVGKQIIVGFPNFGHWEIRLKLLVSGRMPNSRTLPYQWYDTPNIHLFTLADFEQLCDEQRLAVLSTRYRIAGDWHAHPPWPKAGHWLASQAIYQLKQG